MRSGRRQIPCNPLPPSVSQTEKLRPSSDRKLATRQQGVSDTDLEPGLQHLGSLLVRTMQRNKNHSLKPFATWAQATTRALATPWPQPPQAHMWPPSCSFGSLLSVVPCCKLRLTHKYLVKAGLSRWAIYFFILSVCMKQTLLLWPLNISQPHMHLHVNLWWHGEDQGHPRWVSLCTMGCVTHASPR